MVPSVSEVLRGENPNALLVNTVSIELGVPIEVESSFAESAVCSAGVVNLFSSLDVGGDEGGRRRCTTRAVGSYCSAIPAAELAEGRTVAKSLMEVGREACAMFLRTVRVWFLPSSRSATNVHPQSIIVPPCATLRTLPQLHSLPSLCIPVPPRLAFPAIANILIKHVPNSLVLPRLRKICMLIHSRSVAPVPFQR